MSFNQTIIKQDESINFQLTPADFDLSAWLSRAGSVSLAGGRGGSQKIVLQNEAYVLRKYIRGGLMAKLFYDQYIWSGITRSRPFIEEKAIQLAIRHELPVPPVLGYMIQKQGLLYRASIISRFIHNQGTLASVLYDNKMPDENWLELGSTIKRMHLAGIFHPDLNANNILIGQQSGFYIIDFDKAKIIPGMGSLGEKNIQRLQRSLIKIQTLRKQQGKPFNYDRDQWQILLNGYR